MSLLTLLQNQAVAGVVGAGGVAIDAPDLEGTGDVTEAIVTPPSGAATVIGPAVRRRRRAIPVEGTGGIVIAPPEFMGAGVIDDDDLAFWMLEEAA